ncbi:MarR family transcriptional regulator [Sphingomonas cynarae]|uniref:MarR family transcriptional regulator n=1 Tax=Sphingomonas cynarae TaxID=930197 RepID=A0ABP7ENN3_9SPHN
MTTLIPPPADLFLREDAIRGGMDLMLFAHSRHLRKADEELSRWGLGRAHHRVLYFVARRPEMTVGELLAILGIAKQSFARVARQLTDKDLLSQRPGDRDRRQRLLTLTDAGAELEMALFADMRHNMAQAYAAAGGPAVAGFWMVMQNLMGEEARGHFSRLHGIGGGGPRYPAMASASSPTDNA